MSHSHPKKHIPYCLNCHYPLAEFDSFCPNCGQKPTDGKATMHDLLHEFTHTLFHVDGKLFSTLKHIFVPGKLTEEFFKGHHKRYAHPIQLYLVLGAAFLFLVSITTHDLEEQLQHKLDQSTKKNEKKRLLAELDSTAQTLDKYKNNPSVRATIDSLLSKKFADVERPVEKNKNQIYDELNEEIVKNRLIIAKLQVKKDSIDPKLKEALVEEIGERQTELKGFEQDSVNLVTTSAESQKISKQDAERLFNTYVIGKRFGKGWKVAVNGERIWGAKDSTISNISQKLSEELQEDADEEVNDIIQNLKPEGGLSGSIQDFKRGMGKGKKMVIKSKAKPYDTEKNMQKIKKDSVGIFGITISQKDLEDLSPDEIIEKYHVEGFWKRRIVARTVKFQKSGGDMLHTFFSKFLWIITFSLLPTAAFLWLLYRRQKRYYVEHVVWLLHINCLMFILFPLTFIDRFVTFPGFISYTLLCLLLPFFAMKRYYKQSWRKTFAKFFLFTWSYYFIGMAVFILGGFISLLFL
ncbi:MAG: DUF3667 domain-containing protein [Saprospiraceae bacterium]|nr:DUF3667 domain-containing protein [Saprospiraceae bacterium]